MFLKISKEFVKSLNQLQFSEEDVSAIFNSEGIPKFANKFLNDMFNSIITHFSMCKSSFFILFRNY